MKTHGLSQNRAFPFSIGTGLSDVSSKAAELCGFVDTSLTFRCAVDNLFNILKK